MTRIAIVGCGFWAGYQVAAWHELPDADVVAVCDQHPDRARALADRFGIAGVFTDVPTMLDTVWPDLVDVITTPETHAQNVRLAVARGIPVISQKPLTPSWAESKALVAECVAAGVPLFVHENWRWQTPLRTVHRLLTDGAIGRPFRARFTFSHNFPVFDNQPNLKELDEMAIADVGVHLLDTARFLFGEAESVYALTSRITPDIRGEDVATILLRMQSGCQCVLEISFATEQERPSFPQTMLHVEGTGGTLSLREDYEIAVSKAGDTQIQYAAPPTFAWANPDYAVAHSSVYACNQNLLGAVRGKAPAETTGPDNLETLRLTYAAYASAREGRVIRVKEFV